MQRTIYSADAIEKEIDVVAGTTKIRTYLPLGLGFTEESFTGTAIAPTSVGTAVERYFHKDNLGSPVVVTDASQTVLERMAYDAWGRRRQSNGLEVGWQYLNAQSATNTMDHRGYTGQEQLDDLSLVHLNGRVYDPMTGRMTSPDPTIPNPYDLQSLNRASYVLNSPMDKTDPTGFEYVTGSMISHPEEDVVRNSYGYTGVHTNNYNPAHSDPTPAVAAAGNVPTLTPSHDASKIGGGSDAKDAASNQSVCNGSCHGYDGTPGRPMTKNMQTGLEIATAVVTLPIGGGTLLELKGAAKGIPEALNAAGRAGDIGKDIVGWGTKQTAEGVAKTVARIEQINAETVGQMARQGLTREWIDTQAAKYANALEAGGRKAINEQLVPRLELMLKIMDSWTK